MILSRIKQYLMANRRATLCELSVHFDIEQEAMRGMLSHWMRKGKVLKSEMKSECGSGCDHCCDAATLEIYAWVFCPDPNLPISEWIPNSSN